jgi:hypothetical protein
MLLKQYFMVNTTDRLLHDVISTFLIVVSSIYLLGRVIWQKHYHIRLLMRWYRHQKMAVQIFPVFIFYLCSVVPYGIDISVNTFSAWLSIDVNVQQLYFFY